MKKGISYWSFPGGLDGTKNVEACLREAKAAGFEGVELSFPTPGVIDYNSTQADMERILKQAEAIGIQVASLASGAFWGTNLTSGSFADFEKLVTKMLELASYLKVDSILVIPGAVDIFFDPAAAVVPYDVAYNKCLEGLKKLAGAAEQYQVAIAVENVWNKLFLSPLELRDFVDKIGSEYVGVYFDVGNAVLNGYPEHWIKILGKRIKKVHFKDFRRSCGTAEGFVDLLEGDVNWPAVMAAFAEIGYDDWAIAEMIPLYQHYPEVRLANTARAMDQILGRGK